MNRSLKIILLAFIYFLSLKLVNAQNERPKVGLVLSGGGARGMAHISLIKALDSLDIQVDYIAGTSIGSVIGALYSIGYSGKEIEILMKSQDWEALFDNQIALNNIAIEEKREYSRYITAFPIRNGGVSLPDGVINGQSLTNALTEILSPAYQAQNFDSLPIPFHCIATDIVTGEPVVLDSGNLGEAVRASMALPTIFPPIKIDGKLLVDGGLIYNFPVQEVKNMGADIIIGSYTGTTLKEEQELNNALDILYQSSSFYEIQNSEKLKDSCDILFAPDLTGIDVLSFDQIETTIAIGDKSTRPIIHEFDYLPKKYQNPNSKTISPILKISVDSIVINGNNYVSDDYIKSKLRKTLKKGDIDFKTLRKEIDRVFGSRLFEYAYFKIDEVDEKVILTIQVKERPRAYVKFGLHYDSYNQANIVLNLTLRNLLLKNSRFLLTGALSNRPKAELSYLKYIGKKRSHSFDIGSNYNNFDFPVYSDSDKQLEISYKYLNFYSKLQTSINQNLIVGIGVKQEYTYLNSRVFLSSFLEQESHSNSSINAFVDFNSLDRWYYPNKGTRVSGSLTYTFNVNSDFENDTIVFNENQSFIINVTKDNFAKATIDFESYLPINRHLVFNATANIGYIINNNTLLINGNFIGGVNKVSHLGRSCIGLSDMEVVANSFLIIGTEPRVEMLQNLYFSTPLNLLLYEQESIGRIETQDVNTPDHVFGFGAQLSYNSIIGPVEVIVHNNHFLDKWRLNLNIGFFL